MEVIVSVVRPPLAAFDPDAKGLDLNGANLAFATALRTFANADEVEALEVFLAPREMLPMDRLAACADAVLEPHRRGQGRLRFHALPNLPSVWSDSAPRILFCQDLYLLSRERYLRDRFARGAMALSTDVHCLGHRDIWTAFREIAPLAAVAYDRVVATSRSVEEGIRHSFACLGGPPPFSLSRRPRPVDVRTYRPASDEARRFARRALRLREEGTIALYLSRLTPNDKADLLPLVDAFADVAGSDDLLLLVGVENVPGYAQALRARAAERGANVQILTALPRGAQPLVYAAADLFVFPGDTIQEALPTVMLEAMACGLPILASDWDGCRDLVEPERTGLLVPTVALPPPPEIEALFPASDFQTDFLMTGQSVHLDQKALVEALARLLRDAPLRRRMGEAARQKAEDALDAGLWWRNTVEEWRESLRMAADEDSMSVARRREEAERSSLAMPFGKIFAHYATRTLPLDERVALTAEGSRALRGETTPAFYDATLPMLTPTLVPALLRTLASEPTVERAIAESAEAAGVPPDRARFALALLLKRGLASV